jgi:hypothetical protein
VTGWPLFDRWKFVSRPGPIWIRLQARIAGSFSRHDSARAGHPVPYDCRVALSLSPGRTRYAAAPDRVSRSSPTRVTHLKLFVWRKLRRQRRLADVCGSHRKILTRSAQRHTENARSSSRRDAVPMPAHSHSNGSVRIILSSVPSPWSSVLNSCGSKTTPELAFSPTDDLSCLVGAGGLGPVERDVCMSKVSTRP